MRSHSLLKNRGVNWVELTFAKTSGIPGTIAGRTLAPVSSSFLKWLILVWPLKQSFFTSTLIAIFVFHHFTKRYLEILPNVGFGHWVKRLTRQFAPQQLPCLWAEFLWRFLPSEASTESFVEVTFNIISPFTLRPWNITHGIPCKISNGFLALCLAVSLRACDKTWGNVTIS